MQEVEVYDYSNSGEPTLEWLDKKKGCILVFNNEQVDFINKQRMLKYLFHEFCKRQKIGIKIKGGEKNV